MGGMRRPASAGYLEAQLKMELSAEERQFCRELFAAMYEDSARITDPAKIVYPYTFAQVKDGSKKSYYNESYERNVECAQAISAVINDSCYKPNHYNFELAAILAVHAYGFERVNAVLAYELRRAQNDGRYSETNKKWALRPDFDYPEAALNGAYSRTHALLLNNFTDYAHKLYADLGAERFALPGREESGVMVQGYELTRSIWFDDQRGFVTGHSHAAPGKYVCWQFRTEQGKRWFSQGVFGGEKEAADSYRVRIIAHLNGGDVKEIPNQEHIIALESQTAEKKGPMEAERSLPSAAGADGHQSTLAQIRAAKTAPKPPRKEKRPKGSIRKGETEL
ncbi:MAG: DUF3849 domain-containing protein [Gracilibacteraceae bacterium]|jgi:hypothetical protein|nr:DUF3849 domain-containing protein [Gracilibacteraceae bacterium]